MVKGPQGIQKPPFQYPVSRSTHISPGSNVRADRFKTGQNFTFYQKLRQKLNSWPKCWKWFQGGKWDFLEATMKEDI